MFNKEKAFEEIKNNLPIFYKDYFIDEGLYQTASVSMMHAVDMLNTYIIDTFANNNIKTAETYRNIPYISFDASDGFYSYSRIADVPQIHVLLGVSSSYTSSEIPSFIIYHIFVSLFFSDRIYRFERQFYVLYIISYIIISCI